MTAIRDRRRTGRKAAVAAFLVASPLVIAACSSAPVSPNLSTAATTVEREGRFDCQATRQRMAALATSMSNLPSVAKSQAAALPNTAAATWQRLTGPRGSGIASVTQFDAEKARYDALQAGARANGCNTADIDKTYDKAVQQMAEFRSGKS